MAWLSRKDIAKAYGSTVICVTKGSGATRLLQEQHFHIAGESAYAINVRQLGKKLSPVIRPKFAANAQRGPSPY